MTPGGVDILKAALRRSIPLIVGLVVLGIAATNAFKQQEGPRYESSARVLVSSTPLSSIITGTQASFVDPSRVQQTAVDIADSPQVYILAAAQTSEQFGDAEALESASGVVADPNSDLITFTAEASDADQAVGRVNAVANGYISFRQRLSSEQISSTIEGLRSSLSALPEDSAEYSEVQAQLNQLEVLNEGTGDTQLVQEAISAEQTSPSPLTDSLLGLAIGLIIALVIVALREAVDTTVRSEAQVEDLLSAPVLASVRSVPRLGRGAANKRMVSYGRRQALFADSYALLESQLMRGIESEDGIVVAVTSCVAKEGKTTTAANLAVALARRGRDVVLADFDLRKGILAEVFGLPPGARGALQVMYGGDSLEGRLWSVSLEGRAPKASQEASSASARSKSAARDPGESAGTLRLLPSGGALRSTPQLAQLSSTVDALQATADVVVLDTPPALATVEVAELSQIVDSILVVVRQGRSSQRALASLSRQARTWQANLAGAVLTDVRTEGGYSYYGNR